MTPIQIVRLSDRRWVQVANKFLAQFPNISVAIYFIGNASESHDEKIEEVKFGTRAFSIQRMDLVLRDYSGRVCFARGRFSSINGPVDLQKFRSHRESAHFDEVCLFSESISVEISRAIEKLLSEVRYEYVTSGESAADDLSKIVLSQLDQLRSLSLEFSERQLQAERRLEAQFNKRQNAFDKEIESRRSEINSERADLEKYRLEINDREPQHERRRLREALTEDIHSRISIQSLPSRSQESGVSKWYFALSAILLVGSVVLTLAMPSDVDGFSLWSRTFKTVALGLGGAAFGWAGLSQLKTAAASARKFEENALRYRFDIDRASWVVETILQLNSFEGREIPQVWLENVCRDLFRSSDGGDAHENKSLEAFAALFDATARAKIGSDGINFEIDKKGAKKLAD